MEEQNTTYADKIGLLCDSVQIYKSLIIQIVKYAASSASEKNGCLRIVFTIPNPGRIFD